MKRTSARESFLPLSVSSLSTVSSFVSIFLHLPFLDVFLFLSSFITVELGSDRSFPFSFHFTVTFFGYMVSVYDCFILFLVLSVFPMSFYFCIENIQIVAVTLWMHFLVSEAVKIFANEFRLFITAFRMHRKRNTEKCKYLCVCAAIVCVCVCKLENVRMRRSQNKAIN